MKNGLGFDSGNINNHFYNFSDLGKDKQTTEGKEEVQEAAEEVVVYE